MSIARTRLWIVVPIVGLCLVVAFLYAVTFNGLTPEAQAEGGWQELYGYSSNQKVTSLPLQEISTYANFLYTNHRRDLDWPDEADLQALRDAGLGTVLSLDPRVVENGFDASELQALKARLDPYQDVVWALSVIDEPYRPNRQPPLTEQELSDLVDQVKAIFPEYTMYVNFLAPAVVERMTGQPFPGVPNNIDLISTDIFVYLQQVSGDQQYKTRVGRSLDIILDRAQGRPVLYAAPAFGVMDDPTTWASPQQAQLDYELYEQYGLTGLEWHFYEEYGPGGGWYGASHWPDLIDKHQEIGQWILGSQPSPTATPTPLPATATPTPLPATATPTSLPATATPTPLPATATPTPLPATATPTPLPATATPTSLPATATPTPTGAGGERLHGYSSYKKLTDLPLQEIAGYANFVYTYHRANLGWPDTADLQALRDAGLGAHLKLDASVVEGGFDAAELQALKARLDPYRDVVWALAVIDEPYRPNRQPPLTEQELSDLVDQVKAIFPEYTMYVNFLAPYYVEQVTGQPFPGVPDNIDLISTDIYIHLPQTSGDAEYKMRVGRNLDIILDRAQGRPVFYAAQAYGVVDDPTTWASPQQAQLDYELCEEYGLIGLGWFFYDEISPGGSWYGASHWPALIDKHQEIGAWILGTQPPPTATPASPTPTPLPVTPTPSPTPGGGGGGGPVTSGNVKLLALRVNLTDASVACTEAELQASTFAATNSVNAVYSESSRGALTITGDVATVAIDYSTADGCVKEDWATAADEAATIAGYNLSDYDRLVYLMPSELLGDVCPWGGTFAFGGEQVWSLRCGRPLIVAHELGHTFGLYHAATEAEERGDRSDPMGGGQDGLIQLNAPHLDQMGWLTGTAVLDVTTTGVYPIEATEVDPQTASHPQILRVAKPDSEEYYYVSFRRAIGLDANLAPEYRDDVVSIHRFRGFGQAPGYGPPKTYLLDLLGDGESFVDPTNGITISMVSHAGNVATVSIEP